MLKIFFANFSAALAIKSDGSIVSWGDDRYGQAVDIVIRICFQMLPNLFQIRIRSDVIFYRGEVNHNLYLINDTNKILPSIFQSCKGIGTYHDLKQLDQTNKVSLNHEFDKLMLSIFIPMPQVHLLYLTLIIIFIF